MLGHEKEIAHLYKKKQIESSTPGQLILLLYDGAIDYLNRASISLSDQGIERIQNYHKNVLAAQKIVTELMVALDFEAGGEIAKNLYRIYEYINYKLASCTIEQAEECTKEVKSLLQEVKKGWVVAVEHEIQHLNTKPTPAKPRPGLNIQG